MTRYKAIATWNLADSLGGQRSASSMWYTDKRDAVNAGLKMDGTITIIEDCFIIKRMPV